MMHPSVLIVNWGFIVVNDIAAMFIMVRVSVIRDAKIRINAINDSV